VHDTCPADALRRRLGNPHGRAEPAPRRRARDNFAGRALARIGRSAAEAERGIRERFASAAYVRFVHYAEQLHTIAVSEAEMPEPHHR
jgi:hypothetical protein